MKFFRKFLCLISALCVSGLILYADLLFSFPEEITMFQSETHRSSLGMGVRVGNLPESVCATSDADTITPLKEGTYTATLNVAGLPLRAIRLNVTQPSDLCVGGNLVGIRIYNKGLIVTNLASISSGGEKTSPAQKSGILPGDIITEINGVPPADSSQVQSLLSEQTTITVKRNNSIRKFSVSPVVDDTDNTLKLGLWVRDSSAGVGTLTYINPTSFSYGALGHGISDSDTGVLFEVSGGSIEESSVVSIEKGKRGTPGQISGRFHGADSIVGTVSKNCETGIFGEFFPSCIPDSEKFPIGVISQVRCGDASILSAVDGEVREYDISILRSMPYGSATKGLFIEITDKALLEITGGIVQGMSGSPIIQDGKIIGAVTHVLVNDPTRGYGIFIENMLREN